MPDDPYQAHEADENRLRASLCGLGGGAGVLAILRRRIPPRLWIAGRWRQSAPLIRRGLATTVSRSTWWTQLWAAYRSRTSDLLAKISRESSSRLIRILAARLVEDVSREAAVATAREFAATLAKQLEADTLAGMADAMATMERGLPAAELRRQLAARLGPTSAQLDQIHKWERRTLREGSLTRLQVLAEVKRRARRAALLRAQVTASDAVVRQVSESRTAVFEASGVLVFSANVGDNRVRDLHRAQTRATRSDPRPARSPWSSAAPFSSRPPYEVRCRCWVESI